MDHATVACLSMKTYSGPAQRIFQGQGGTPRRRAGRGNCMTALSHETVHQADKPWAMRRLTIYPCTRTADSNNTSGECSVCKTRRSVVIHIVSYRIVPHFFSLRQCTAFPLSASHPQTAHALLRSPTPLENKVKTIKVDESEWSGRAALLRSPHLLTYMDRRVYCSSPK